MQVLKSLLVAAAALASLGSAVARSSGIEGFDPSSAPINQKRGEIQDIAQIIQHKSKVGETFCSSFLHLPPYAATKTVTFTKVVGQSVPISTTTKTTFLTQTADPATVVSTEIVVVPVTPTTILTVPVAVPFTSTVSTVTRPFTSTTTILSTVTSYTPQARNAQEHDPSRTRLPNWLNQYRCPQVSKACSHVVTPKTKTVRKTVTSTRTIKTGVVTIGETSTAVVTPTTTVVDTVSSTSTAPAFIFTNFSPSSSLVPATAIVEPTTFVGVTATTTVYLPAPFAGRVRLNKASDGSLYGYISSTLYPGAGYVTLTSSAAGALTVRLPAPAFQLGGTTFNLGIPGALFPYLGAEKGSGSSNADLSSSSLNYLYLAQVALVPANSQSTDQTQNSIYATSGSYQATYESQVWAIDPVTNVLSFNWANSDGSTFTGATLYYDASVGFLGATGNIDLFKARYPGEQVDVLTATFEPL
ncbi:hypothetical protein OC835_003168 [Tilletia horrida]|nr:hypothetical protein OC835_003168 [Tilletia horrida]